MHTILLGHNRQKNKEISPISAIFCSNPVEDNVFYRVIWYQSFLNSDFGQKRFCLKNRNFAQKTKFWSKIEILLKQQNFGQKSKFCAKIETLVKNRIFGQQSKFWSKIESLLKKRNFSQKSKLWSTKIKISK